MVFHGFYVIIDLINSELTKVKFKKQMLINQLRKLIQEIKLQEALQKGLKEVGHPFKAFFIFGPAGSGKSFIKSSLGLPASFISLNVDEVVEKVFPKFGLSLKFLEGDIEKKQEVRKLLQQAVSDKTKRKINQALPLLFDTTGENTSKMKRIIRSLIEIGYDVAIFQVNVPPDFSVEADKDRPRTIGEPLTRDISNMYQKNIVLLLEILCMLVVLNQSQFMCKIIP